MRTVSVGARSGASAPENSPPAVKNPIFTLAAETPENGADDDTRPSWVGAMRGRRRGRADAPRSDRRPDHGSPTPRDASERVRGFSTTVPARDRRVVGGSAAARLDCGRVFSRPGARVDEPRFTLSDVARRVATPTTMITTGLLSESRRERAGGFAPGSPCRSIVTGLPSRMEKAETSLAPQLWGGGPPAAVSGARARSLP